MEGTQAAQYPHPDKTFYHTHGEFCVVASTTGGSTVDVYETIQQRLHEVIRSVVPLRQRDGEVVPEAPSPPRAFKPTESVWKDFEVADPDDGDARLVRAPVRAKGMRSAHLNHADGTTSFHFFRIAVSPGASRANLHDYTRILRETVNIVYDHFVGQRWQLEDTALTFHAVSPNWLSVMADGGVNSPGTPCVPVAEHVARETNLGRFGFYREIDGHKMGSQALQSIVRNQRNATIRQPLSGIDVAILDTSPTRAAFENARAAFAPHRMLEAMADANNPVIIEDWPSFDPDTDFSHLVHFLPNYLGGLVKWYGIWDAPETTDSDLHALRRGEYGAADHGLFVAGIIKDIAPGARVRLIRVLDDAGVGDLLGIAWVLSLLAMSAAPRRLIVNLSLTFEMLPHDDLTAYWLEALPGADPGFVDAVVTSAENAIALLFGYLREKEVLVVAAAGNNGRGQRPLPDACLPARDPNVFSVSSVTLDLAGPGSGPSFFTNNSDGAHGVATISGDADLAHFPPRMLLENQAGERTDGVVGPFTGKDMTDNATGDPTIRDRNVSGWVYWAGTSFATPIITAIAAAIQGNELANGNAQPLDPASLIARIKSYEDGRQNSEGLACGVVYAYQQ